jgi:hypothetical protein
MIVAMKNRQADLATIALFLVLTLVMTYPLALHLGSGVRDLGDPLLNSWILAWDARQITRLDISSFFDANIFFPNYRTLAYSEHLFVEALVALPVRLVSENPVLAHNLVLLFAFITSALGMYALATHLTRCRVCGFVAGLIYAFSPFMFSHFVHVQVVMAGGIPMTFLFLHRFFEAGRTKDACLFALFYSLQALANGYYALYLALFAGLFIAVKAVAERKISTRKFWLQMLLAAVIIGLLVGPFAYQYLRFQKETNFSRNLGSSAKLSSFLAPAPTNRLYGRITSRFQRPEEHLFPGIMTVLLALGGGIAFVFRRRGSPTDAGAEAERIQAAHLKAYGLILALAFLFTFGGRGPYLLMYKFLPGYSGLRVPARFHIMVMFSLAVLAALGLNFLILKKKKALRSAAAVLISLLIVMEFASFPVPLEEFPPGGAPVPEVYRWLAGQEGGDLAILELPLPAPRFGIGLVECPRMYFSTFHWHSLVNGYSGYFPPVYVELLRRWRECPLAQTIEDAHELGVGLLIFHSSEFSPEVFVQTLEELARHREEIVFVGQHGEAFVYKIIAAAQVEAEIRSKTRQSIAASSEWTATAGVNESMAGRAIDGDRRTRWNSEFQQAGDTFVLDMGKVHEVRGLSLKLGPSTFDYPRGCLVDVSVDGVIWLPAAENNTPLLPIRAFLKANDISYDIQFSPQPARFIRITLTEENDEFYWSIYEIEVYE